MTLDRVIRTLLTIIIASSITPANAFKSTNKEQHSVKQFFYNFIEDIENPFFYFQKAFLATDTKSLKIPTFDPPVIMSCTIIYDGNKFTFTPSCSISNVIYGFSLNNSPWSNEKAKEAQSFKYKLYKDNNLFKLKAIDQYGQESPIIKLRFGIGTTTYP